jgi:hypothetical protein
MRHRLHSYTLTSGAPVLPGIVRATLIGPAQLGHIGEWVFIPQTHWTPLIRVTPVAGKGSDISTAGGNAGLRSAFLCQSPTKFELVIDPKTGDRARLADGSFWPLPTLSECPQIGCYRRKSGHSAIRTRRARFVGLMRTRPQAEKSGHHCGL